MSWVRVGGHRFTILMGAPPDRAGRLVSFILSPAGEAILARHGFAGPAGLGG